MPSPKQQRWPLPFCTVLSVFFVSMKPRTKLATAVLTVEYRPSSPVKNKGAMKDHVTSRKMSKIDLFIMYIIIIIYALRNLNLTPSVHSKRIKDMILKLYMFLNKGWNERLGQFLSLHGNR